ncbi:MAG TPA: quinone-dependent dihydroorotate dehydrogenase [Cytophagaceae bacterium]
MYKNLVRPILFLFDPEKVHYFTFSLIKFLYSIPGGPFIFKTLFQVNDKRLERELFGLTFKNPVGLAAGLDKDGVLVNEMDALGFGFIEIGTLTPEPQPGNDKPRLFRLKSDKALINRMGFNNGGVKAGAERLRKRHPGILVGGNIGKNKWTANEEAYKDYEKCFEALYDCVDYFVVNVSSPNTPGLRALQEKGPLKEILNKLMIKSSSQSKPKSILLKIAPDLTEGQLDDIIEIVQETKIGGVIATNTTISRAGLLETTASLEKIGAGGLSGKPLLKQSTFVVKYLSEKSNKSFPIIAVGGIFSPEDAIEKLEAGAALVHLYTGFIYEGPTLIKAINKEILKRAR